MRASIRRSEVTAVFYSLGADGLPTVTALVLPYGAGGYAAATGIVELCLELLVAESAFVLVHVSHDPALHGGEDLHGAGLHTDLAAQADILLEHLVRGQVSISDDGHQTDAGAVFPGQQGVVHAHGAQTRI